MFGDAAVANTVQPLCCGGASPNGATPGAGLPAPLPATPGYTISGNTIAFPMVDPYRPVSKALVPVPGYSAWPRQPQLGRKYYGLSGPPKPRGSGPVFRGLGEGGDGSERMISSRLRGLSGLTQDQIDSGVYDPTYNPSGSPVYTTPVYSAPTVAGPSTLQTILNSLSSILPSVPAIVSSAEGNPYYNPAQIARAQTPVTTTVLGQPVQTLQPGQPGYIAPSTGLGIGTAFDNFISQNPMVTLMLVGGAVLLFMKPPSRGR